MFMHRSPASPGVRSARPVVVVAVLVMAMFSAGCGVVWDAPNVGLTIRGSDIVYTQVDGPEQLVGGETILEVANASTEPRQVVIARVAEGDEIPPGILDAEAAREDDRIVGFSTVLDAQEISTGAGLSRVTQRAVFHIHLREGERYVVFDTLSDTDGPVRWIQPGPSGDQLASGSS